MTQARSPPLVAASSNSSSEDHNEADNVTSVELQRHRRILHFSDGVMEEPSDSDVEVDVPDKNLELNIDENTLPFVSRFKYRASKVGSHILAGIDYVGEALASLLGITTPKYVSELEYYQHSNAISDINSDEDANNAWQHTEHSRNVQLNEVITTAPKRS